MRQKSIPFVHFLWSVQNFKIQCERNKESLGQQEHAYSFSVRNHVWARLHSESGSIHQLGPETLKCNKINLTPQTCFISQESIRLLPHKQQPSFQHLILNLFLCWVPHPAHPVSLLPLKLISSKSFTGHHSLPPTKGKGAGALTLACPPWSRASPCVRLEGKTLSLLSTDQNHKKHYTTGPMFPYII